MFENIPAMPLELRAGIKTSGLIRYMYNSKHYVNIDNQIHRAKIVSIYIDKITKYSLRLPELRCLVDKIGIYFRWFHINNSILTPDSIEKKIFTQ